MFNFFDRLNEPSTMAGFSVLFGLFGVQVAPELAQGAVKVVAGVTAIAAVLMREKGAAK